MTSPRSCPATKITADTTMASTSVPRIHRAGRKIPAAITVNTAASAIDAASPWCATRPATPRLIDASQSGSPAAIPAIVSCRPWAPRLAGSIAK
jgi:hypothetical protein